MQTQQRRLYLFAVFLVLYEFTTYASNDMIMPGMINIVKQFNAPISLIATSLSLYILGNCALQLFLGPLAERFGKRKVIITGNALFLVFTLMIAMSSNITQFMLGRFFQGSGMAFIAMGYALIHEKFDDKSAVKIISLMANVSILAPLFGPLIGALILTQTSWPHVFIISGVIGSITLYGLFKYTPQSNATITSLNMRDILATYWNITKSRNFLLGTLCSSIAILPGIAWIGLAPTIIMEAEKLSYISYILYSAIAISGLTISSRVMQYAAGKISFFKLISRGNLVAFIGLIIGIIFNTHINVFVGGLFLYMFGLGIFNGSIMRIIMSGKEHTQGMVVSLMVFIQTLSMGVGIEIINYLNGLFGFSLVSYSIICFIIGCVMFTMVHIFAKRNKSRVWE